MYATNFFSCSHCVENFKKEIVMFKPPVYDEISYQMEIQQLDKKKLKDLKSEETEFFESKTKQSEANKLKADAEVNFE